MNTPKPASSENENARLINSAFAPLYHVVDRDFDDMVNFGLHDEHDVRAIMDLPTPVEAKSYGF